MLTRSLRLGIPGRVQLGTHSSPSPPSVNYLIEEDSLNYLIEEDSLNRLIEQPTILKLSEPIAPPDLSIINSYRSHGVIAEGSGFESTVLVENGIVRIWYSKASLTNETYAYGGVNYGTVQYPFVFNGVAYREISVIDFENTITNEIDFVWQNEGICVPSCSRSFVAKGADGKYNMLAVNMTSGLMEWWQSDTGNPSTWTLISASLGIFDTSYGIGNCSFNWNGSAWDVWIEYAKWTSWTTWRVSYWTGATLGALTRVDSNTTPAMVSTASVSVGVVLPTQYSNKWVHIGHGAKILDGNLPTSISFLTSNAKNTGWVVNKWLKSIEDMPYFMGNVSRPITADSQYADPDLFEVNGKTYMIYETTCQQKYDIPSLTLVWWDADMTTVVNYLINN